MRDPTPYDRRSPMEHERDLPPITTAQEMAKAAAQAVIAFTEDGPLRNVSPGNRWVPRVAVAGAIRALSLRIPTPDEDVAEKVGRALWEHHSSGMSWEVIPENWRVDYCNKARAAIAAMPDLAAENARLRAELDECSGLVAIAAAHLARGQGLPDGHILAPHYDLMERLGLRVASFTRAGLGEPSSD